MLPHLFLLLQLLQPQAIQISPLQITHHHWSLGPPLLDNFIRIGISILPTGYMHYLINIQTLIPYHLFNLFQYLFISLNNTQFTKFLFTVVHVFFKCIFVYFKARLELISYLRNNVTQFWFVLWRPELF